MALVPWIVRYPELPLIVKPRSVITVDEGFGGGSSRRENERPEDDIEGRIILQYDNGEFHTFLNWYNVDTQGGRKWAEAPWYPVTSYAVRLLDIQYKLLGGEVWEVAFKGSARYTGEISWGLVHA